MKLQLTNFLCWKEKTIEFSNGLILLSGPSGSGKSSILKALVFLITGEGNKLCFHGTNTCQVQLWYQNYHIIRTKRPNRLVVDDIYQDESAQEILDSIFSHFKTVSYIQQKGANSFLEMSPLEKITFLENVAFEHVDIIKMKDKVKNMVSQREKKFDSVSNKLTFLQEEFVKLPVLRIEDKPKNSSDVLDQERNEHLQTKQKLETVLKNLTKRYTEMKAYEEIKDVIDEELNNLHKERNSIVLPIYSTLKISELTEELQCIENNREFDTLSQQYKELQERYQTQLNEENQRLSSEIEKIYIMTKEEKEEIKSLISSYQKINKLHNEEETIKKEIEKISYNDKDIIKLKEQESSLKDQIRKIELSKEIKVCPKCKTNLRFVKGELTIDEKVEKILDNANTCKKELETVLKTLQQEENKKNKFLYLQEELNKLNKQYENIRDNKRNGKDNISETEYNKLIEKIKNNDMLENKKNHLLNDLTQLEKRSIFVNMKKSLDKLQQNLKTYDDYSENNNNEKDNEEDEKDKEITIKKELDEESMKKKDFINLSNQISALQQKISSKTSLLERRKINDLPSIEILQSLSSTEESLSKVNFSISFLDTEIPRVKLYEYNEKNRVEKEKEIAEISNTLQEVKKDFNIAKIFKEKINEAESIALFNLIEYINSHLSLYLETFFKDYPITVEISPIKETLKGEKKNQICINIGYRGMNIDISALSGGERDRVDLAFTLAISEMFSSPLIMLDESFSSLDNETTEEILHSLERTDRTIIVVAHQVTTGLFNQVIKV